MLLLLPLFSAAQEHRVGLYQGYSNSSVSDDNLFINKVRRHGYSGGITYGIAAKNMEYSLGINYTQRGFAFLISYYPDSTSNEKKAEFVYYRNDYIGIPMSVHYRGTKRFFGQFGLSVIPAWLISSKTYLGQEFIPGSKDSGPSKFDLGGQLNLGCGIQMTEKWSILFRLSFYRSVTGVNNENFYPGNDFYNKSSSLGFCLEYRIK